MNSVKRRRQLKQVLAICCVGCAYLNWIPANAAIIPPAEAALTAWSGTRVATRPPVPSLATRSLQTGQIEPDPAGATRLLLGKHTAVAPISVPLSVAAERLLGTPGEDVVSTLAFTAADGSRQEFAAHFRPDDARPLYWRADGYPSQGSATFAQAQQAAHCCESTARSPSRSTTRHSRATPAVPAT